MKKAFLLILVLSFLLAKTFAQNYADVQGTWNGTASLVEKLSGQFVTSERHIELTIKDNQVTGTVKYSADVKVGNAVGHDECFGSGSGELISVNIRTWDGTYDINIEGPECKLIAGGGNSGDGLTGIGISDQKLQLINGQPNTTELSGTETTTRNVENMGTFTRTITWHMVSSLDVELIVTPVGYDITGAQKNYDDWLPEPGKDEISKGSVMKIMLSLKSKSGKPLKYKAQSFELKLSNTSREPGITINYPLSPRANQLPDLRFIPLAIAESEDEDQYITISSKNGISGETFIASYDGGGATTLTVEALIDGRIHIKGQLLVSGGDEEIQIPKRVPGTMIATAWRKANGNPEESKDEETSKDNKNNGDGLTAYEEYRGVISEGKYKRLDPRKKELGILVNKQSEKKLFAGGFSMFTNGTGIDIVLFDKNEIPDNRRLNQNAHTANSFKQYVLRIAKGNTSEKDIYGYVMKAYGVTYPTNDIPARVTHITIDVDVIHAHYLRDIAVAPNLPYTEQDMLFQTIAHEIGHGVNIDHHGEDLPYIDPMTVVSSSDTIIDVYRGPTVRDRPYTITGRIGQFGNQQCGDVNCVMCYVNKSFWVKLENHVTSIVIFRSVPILPLGKKICNDKKGTGINDLGLNYGNAKKGNCLAQIKLRD